MKKKQMLCLEYNYQTFYPTAKTLGKSWKKIKTAYNKLFIVLNPSRSGIDLQ